MAKKSKKTCPECNSELLDDGSCPSCGSAGEEENKEGSGMDEEEEPEE